MNKDDRRYRAAYHLLHDHIASQIALGHLTGGTRAEAKRVLASVEAELNPPEFETVGVGAYFVIPTDGDVYTQVSEDRAMQMRDEGYTVAFLSATVKRPVRRAVIREYEVAAKIGALGDVIGVGLTSRPFLDYPECHGKAGVLIFRTAE